MKRLISYLTLLIFVLSTNVKAQSFNTKALDKYIEKSRKEWQIPAMAVAVVKDGKVIFSKGYGYRDVENKKKADKNTLFAIASNSKAFTTTALAKLVDEGKINWNDKVIEHLEWFKMYDPYVTNNMTIRDLVSHRSGLKTFSGDLLWYHTNYSAEEVVRRAQYLKPVYGFRDNFGYQNIMFSAAGLIIEKHSGKSWGEYIQENFLDKLSMKNSNTSVKQLDFNKNVAIPYNVIPDKAPVAMNYLPWDNCAAAAGINSSAEDMSKWIIFQLNNGKIKDEQIVSEKEIFELRKLVTPTPVSLNTFKNDPNTHYKGYGMGWNVYDFNGKKVINHGGGSDGMISKVAMIPEENFGFVILTNSINYLPSALSNKIMDMYFGNEEKDWSKLYLSYYKDGLKRDEKRVEDLWANQVKNTKPSNNLEAYTGEYKDKAYGLAVIEEKDGKLLLKYPAAPNLIGEMEHYHYDVWTVKLKDIESLPIGTVQFFMDEKTNIRKMKVDIPNPDFYFDEFDFVKIN